MQQFERALATALSWIPAWLTSLLLFSLAIVLAYSGGKLLHRTLTRVVADRDLFWRSLVKRLELPLRLGLGIIFCWMVSIIAPLTIQQSDVVRHGLLIAIIVLGVLAARTVLHIWITVYLRRFKLDSDDNLLARKHVTQSRILERVAVVLLFLIGIAAILMTFEGVAQYGVSLLASAGAAGIVLGLALQPLLKNLFAGIQLAITQPIRIDDALLIEGEWGTVEEITATYVVVKIWDWRRLIVPLGYFMDQPFQNWTRESASLIGNVMLYVDYSAPVDAIRTRTEEIARQSPHWDGNIVGVQVTDFREGTMELRILVTARTAGKAFDLRCEVREKLIAFLQEEYPHALPRIRMEPNGLPDNSRRLANAGIDTVESAG